MSRDNILSFLYSKDKSPLEFKWDSLMGPNIFNIFTVQEVNELHRIATSVKLSAKIDEKYRLINEVMNPKGFKKFHAGTNRVVYTCYENPSIVVKIAIDQVGMQDNPLEYRNQIYLKPFVTKCFDISPCGTIGIFERVEPITSVEDFAYISDDVFALLTKRIIGVYVLEDIGAKFYNNYGVRPGFGPCLLDYPYMYKLDGNKLLCNRMVDQNFPDILCGGEIDYDDGFNYLVCSKCGKKYSAKDLQEGIKSKIIILQGGLHNMKVCIRKGNRIIGDPIVESKIIERPSDAKVHVPSTLKVFVAGVKKKEASTNVVDNNSPLVKRSQEDIERLQAPAKTPTVKVEAPATVVEEPKVEEVKVEEPKVEEKKPVKRSVPKKVTPAPVVVEPEVVAEPQAEVDTSSDPDIETDYDEYKIMKKRESKNRAKTTNEARKAKRNMDNY